MLLFSKKGIYMYVTVLILKISAQVHIPGRRHNHVDIQTNEDKFDRELFEPMHDGSDGDEHAMDGDHGLHNENLYDEDGVIRRQAQGTTTTSIYVMLEIQLQ
jgi:hypothetical protein